MFRTTIKIDRLPMVARRGVNPTEETSSELVIQAKGKDIPEAIEKAIRHLTAELTAISDAKVINMSEDDDDEEED